MKSPLRKAKDLHHWAKGALPWVSCQPFVENSRAVLIHRPRCVTTHKISERFAAHIGIQLWCGASFTGTKKFTFLDAPPDGRLLCARCEAIATKNGVQSCHELTGKHFHLGGVVAVQLCCIEGHKS